MLRSSNDYSNNNSSLFFPYESPVVAGTSLALGFQTSPGRTNRGGQVTLSTNSQQGGIFTCTNSTCFNVTPTADSQWASGSLVAVSPYPFIDSLSQIAGPTSGGNTITLTGVNLSGTTDVMFGSVSAGVGNFTVINDTTITVTVPAQSSGTYKIKVVKGNLSTPTTDALSYEYFAPAAINVRILTGNSTTASIVDATRTDSGVQVQGMYTYSSSRSEVIAPGTPNSTYRWALNNVNTGPSQRNANGANVTGSTVGGRIALRGGTVTNLNAVAYTPVDADLGQYLYYCVKPAALLSAVGLESCSPAIQVGRIQSANGTTATGSGAISATFRGGSSTCSLTESAFVAAPSTPPGGVSFPHGFFQFKASTCNPGDTITMTVTYPNQIPAGALYYKYGKERVGDADHYFTIPASIEGNRVTFTLTDGQKGDIDLNADGTITDPGGLGVTAEGATAIPTLNEYSKIILSSLIIIGFIGRTRLKRFFL